MRLIFRHVVVPRIWVALVVMAVVPLFEGELLWGEADKAKDAPKSDIATKVELASVYQETMQLDEARKHLETILDTDPGNLPAKERLKEVLAAQRSRNVERQARQLEVAEWYVGQDNPEKAVEIAQALLQSTDDDIIEAGARNILKVTRASWGRKFTAKAKPSGLVVDLAYVLAFVVFLWLALPFLRYLYTKIWPWLSDLLHPVGGNASRGTVWRIDAIKDTTNLAVASLVMTLFSRLRTELSSPPVSAGLLKLESLALPAPAFVLEDVRPRLQLSEVVQDLPLKVGTADVSGVTKFFAGLRGWFRAKLPAVTGVALLSSGTVPHITVRLTRHGPAHRIKTVSASTAVEAESDAAATCAEKAVHKMYYVLGRPEATEEEVDFADFMREGLKLLQRYVTGEKSALLEQALQKFEAFRKVRPDFLEAYLYEGVTLDLLERHEEAITRFEHVHKNTAPGSPLEEKALYNKAVAYMRKYRPDDLKTAEDIFSEVIGEKPDALKQPIKVLAEAGKANAVAHYPIFWQRLVYGRKAADDAERVEWKKAEWMKSGGPEVMKWRERVNQISDLLRADAESIRKADFSESRWDAVSKRQLEWAISNAVGNVHLNVATGFLEPPLPPDVGNTQEMQKEFLLKALAEFQECEMLLSPGVETLTNLSTALLFLGRYSESRLYAERAIKLNENYEYAYFRLVHSWDREGRPDKAKNELASHRKEVHIAEFKALFQKYNIPLPG